MDEKPVVEGNKPSIPEWPILTENHWYAGAVSLVVITLALAPFVTSWILNASTSEDVLRRVQIAAPFGTVFLALITFCTVAWRGMVSSRQADQQRRQNDANDDANLAKLLQEGAKFLAEYDREPHVMAGIATLDIVIADPQRRFAIQAMDLLAAYVQDHYGEEKAGRTISAAKQALANGEERGIISNVSGTFEKPPGEPRFWSVIHGFRTIVYKGGKFHTVAYDTASKRPTATSFMEVSFNQCQIIGSFSYVRCAFVNCKILSMLDITFHSSIFTDCDFSSCVVTQWLPWNPDKPAISGTGNFYRKGKPPTVDASEAPSAAYDWLAHLTEMDEATAESDFTERSII